MSFVKHCLLPFDLLCLQCLPTLTTLTSAHPHMLTTLTSAHPHTPHSPLPTHTHHTHLCLPTHTTLTSAHPHMLTTLTSTHPHMLTSSLVGLESTDGGSLSLLLLAGATLGDTRCGRWTTDMIANEYLLQTVLCVACQCQSHRGGRVWNDEGMVVSARVFLDFGLVLV